MYSNVLLLCKNNDFNLYHCGYYIDSQGYLCDPDNKHVLDTTFDGVEDVTLVKNHIVLTTQDKYKIVDIRNKKITDVTRSIKADESCKKQIYSVSFGIVRPSTTFPDKKVVEFLIDNDKLSHRISLNTTEGYCLKFSNPSGHTNVNSMKVGISIAYSVTGNTNCTVVFVKNVLDELYEELYRINSDNEPVGLIEERDFEYYYNGLKIIKCKKISLEIHRYIENGEWVYAKPFIFETDDGMCYEVTNKKITAI